MTDDATAHDRQPECTDAPGSQNGPERVQEPRRAANDPGSVHPFPETPHGQKKALHDDFALAPPPPPDHARWPIWRAMTEADWQAQVIRMATQLGYRCYHSWLSVKSNPGYPDVHAVRPDREVYLECKTETGSLSENQRQWLALLLQASHRAYVVFPHDEDALEDLLT